MDKYQKLSVDIPVNYEWSIFDAKEIITPPPSPVEEKRRPYSQPTTPI
jgi:hypothetical protein